ncbi:MAG: SURF1 family protein [Salinarimonas sp.]|nr:SURF1 family protein [Salinarimonas sp.]
MPNGDATSSGVPAGGTRSGPSNAALIAAAIATVVSLAILITLGNWQMERLAWKEGLIAQMQERAYGEPGAILPPGEWGNYQPQEEEYRRVSISGRFLHAEEVAVHGLMPTRTRGNPVQGFYLLTPLEIGEGARVFVNRGFVPTSMRDPAARPAPPPEGEVNLTGLVRAPEERGMFVPENIPQDERWMVRDIAQMGDARRIDGVAPFYIDAEFDPDAPDWPRAGATVLDPPNNHLQYALTWYGLAAVLAVIFLIYARPRLRSLMRRG